jgi:hypothetical protein
MVPSLTKTDSLIHYELTLIFVASWKVHIDFFSQFSCLALSAAAQKTMLPGDVV